MRIASAAALLGAALAVSPARAQPAPYIPLMQYVASPIPYRISLPRRWRLAESKEMVRASSRDALLIVVAADVLRDGDADPSLPEAERRRIVTRGLLGPDSVLTGMVGEMMKKVAPGSAGGCTGVVREVRELNGIRAGFFGGLCAGMLREPVRLEAYLTVKDAVMYLLVYGAAPDAFAAHRRLFARVRESLVLADAPAAASRRP
jgi:hypothetical protein